MINSIYRTGKSYYPQAVLEECNYGVTEKRCLSILLTMWKFHLTKKMLMKKMMRIIKYIMRLLFVFEAFLVILGFSENYLMVKLIFKVYKKN